MERSFRQSEKAVGRPALWYQGNRSSLSGTDDENGLPHRPLSGSLSRAVEATGPYNQTSTTIYNLHFAWNYANSGARAAYDQIVSMLNKHNTIPSFLSGGKNDITKELAYRNGNTASLTDKTAFFRLQLFKLQRKCERIKSGNKLTISSTAAVSGSVRITAMGTEAIASQSAKLIAYGDPNLQDLVTGVKTPIPWRHISTSKHPQVRLPSKRLPRTVL
ncbi:MAG: hypothetical protein ACLSGX_10900 [Pseudoruminococcus massiliensis]|uniref:hypothetical protein n=1 Tax=Pseudoruminococcus massiliensis TaxID=2086583 RepID=UPI003991A50D